MGSSRIINVIRNQGFGVLYNFFHDITNDDGRVTIQVVTQSVTVALGGDHPAFMALDVVTQLSGAGGEGAVGTHRAGYPNKYKHWTSIQISFSQVLKYF